MKPLLHLTFCAALLALWCLDVDAQTRKRVPRFEDYPVKAIHQGPSAKPILQTDQHRSAVIYYQAIADGGASFAGHYAVVPLTCGESCSMADFLDTKTGQIVPGTFSNSGWKERHDAFREMEFRRGSRLIVFAGRIDEKGPLGWHFYLFDRGRLKRIHTIVTKGDFRKPLTEWMK